MLDYTNWPESCAKLRKTYESLQPICISVNRLLRDTETIIVYGAGYNGLAAVRELRVQGVAVKYFCDSNEKLIGKVICGIPVLGLERLREISRNTAIIITPSFASVYIEKMLIEMGFTNLFVYGYALGNHIPLKFFSEKSEEKQRIAAQNKEKIDYVMSRLADEHSLDVFSANMKLWLYGEYEEAVGVRTNEGYYPSDIITLENDEVFVDCGAYNGDSVLEFVEKTNGNYRMIYAYEADELSYEMAKRALTTKMIDNVSISNIGVFNKKTTRCFANDGYLGNRIIIEGGITIPVDSLDNLLRERPHPITFIKMDIEGAELEALHGAHEIIRTDAPKLAISVYHKYGDIWDIPHYILTHFTGYKIYLRNEYAFCDNICFAVKD